jgi:hypothetical protein
MASNGPVRSGSRPEPDVISSGRQTPLHVRLQGRAGAGIALVAIIALATVALTPSVATTTAGRLLSLTAAGTSSIRAPAASTTPTLAARGR